MTFKKQSFDNQELALLFQAFAKNLFIRPTRGDIYSAIEANGCTFCITMEYYEKLRADIQRSYDEGKFMQSNAYGEWRSLMNTFLSAEDINELDNRSSEDYYEEVHTYWG